MRKIIVNEKFNQKKLQAFLQYNFQGLSNPMFFKTLRKKDIRVNGKRITENIILQKNDVVEIYLADQFLFKNTTLNIVYEDENIIIVNKPAGIEVLSNKHNDLTTQLQAHFPSLESSFPYPCHRLDRNTSGLVLYAKNQTVLDILNKKIKTHEVLKFYRCTVVGILEKKEATLKDYLFKDSKKAIVHIRSTPQTGYREIVTSYRVLGENKKDNLSTLEVQLHTGRTHQIRAHLAFIGHPILGDGKYGINEINKKFNKKVQELCAYKLVFQFKTDSGILEYLNGKEFSL